MIAITAYILWGGRDSRPNVALIVLDTTRGDRLSCMGYHRPTILDVCGLGDDTGLLDPLMNSLTNDRPD